MKTAANHHVLNLFSFKTGYGQNMKNVLNLNRLDALVLNERANMLTMICNINTSDIRVTIVFCTVVYDNHIPSKD